PLLSTGTSRVNPVWLLTTLTVSPEATGAVPKIVLVVDCANTWPVMPALAAMAKASAVRRRRAACNGELRKLAIFIKRLPSICVNNSLGPESRRPQKSLYLAVGNTARKQQQTTRPPGPTTNFRHLHAGHP